MSYALRDQFLNSRERQYGEVETSIGMVRFQSMTEGERVRVMDRFIANDESGAAEAAHVIALCVVDQDGHRLFGDEDIEHILDMPSKLIRTIYDAIDEAFGVKASQDNSRIEDTAKN